MASNAEMFPFDDVIMSQFQNANVLHGLVLWQYINAVICVLSRSRQQTLIKLVHHNCTIMKQDRATCRDPHICHLNFAIVSIAWIMHRSSLKKCHCQTCSLSYKTFHCVGWMNIMPLNNCVVGFIWPFRTSYSRPNLKLEINLHVCCGGLSFYLRKISDQCELCVS